MKNLITKWRDLIGTQELDDYAYELGLSLEGEGNVHQAAQDLFNERYRKVKRKSFNLRLQIEEEFEYEDGGFSCHGLNNKQDAKWLIGTFDTLKQAIQKGEKIQEQSA